VRTRAARRPLTPGRPGKHGTLYLWRFRYTPDAQMCAGEDWTCWAYDEDHARERWTDTDEDGGWLLLSGPVRA
jgi:hypothetical protein